jgi:hypothetical protein
MPKNSPESSVAICCGPSLGMLDRPCAQVALGQTAEEAAQELRENHAHWCHPGVQVTIEVAPLHVATLMLNLPQGKDDSRPFPMQMNS